MLGGHESRFSHVTSQGKPVVLNFFAGQCPPCRAKMPGFKKVADEFGGRVIYVGVDIGRTFSWAALRTPSACAPN